MTVQALCHPERPRIARGLCTRCYQRHRHGDASFDALVAQAAKEKQDAITARSVASKQRANARRRGTPWRDHTLRARYGITLADYDALLKQQNGACFICSEPPKDGRPLHVDHCHTTGSVRKLLCARCNTLVAMLERRRDLADLALAYIGKDDRPGAA